MQVVLVQVHGQFAAGVDLVHLGSCFSCMSVAVKPSFPRLCRSVEGKSVTTMDGTVESMAQLALRNSYGILELAFPNHLLVGRRGRAKKAPAANDRLCDSGKTADHAECLMSSRMR